MTEEPRNRVAIIGAGITGLTAGYELARRGLAVDVYEAAPEIGGELGVVRVNGEAVERYYHHLFRGDADIIDLLGELGIGDTLEWRAPTMGFFSGGRLYNFTTPIDLLKFSPLPLLSRLRMGIATMRLQRIKDYTRFEDIRASDYLPRMTGQRTFDTIWRPLLRAKFGEQWDEISMAWFWGRVHVRIQSRSRGGLREELGYIRGSFDGISRALAAKLTELGGKIFPGTPVEAIAQSGGRVTGVRVGGAERTYDRVIGTVGLPILRLLGPGRLSDTYGAIDYRTALVMLLQIDRPAGDRYWTNIGDDDVPFAGLIEHTNFIPPERYGGARLLYVSNYTRPDDRLFGLSDDDLFAKYAPHIQRILPGFAPDAVTARWVTRDPVAQPVITTGYQRRIPPFRTATPGFYVCNTSQIYPEDRGVNYNVRIARQVARTVCEDAGIRYDG
ncbi:MAG TPA: NAD(P)/FAD-dependent oxidoreductase [Chloroflexota bacterium]|nr:NAD(P)/FAD-dependent oxidoreductase [Chloroflexota bacterium]